jgi:KUP system potassium uptake protein
LLPASYGSDCRIANQQELLTADGVITPAISVLSAVEGLKVDAPGLAPMVVPITIAILVGLFLVQRKGTEFVGGIFGQ